MIHFDCNPSLPSYFPSMPTQRALKKALARSHCHTRTPAGGAWQGPSHPTLLLRSAHGRGKGGGGRGQREPTAVPAATGGGRGGAGKWTRKGQEREMAGPAAAAANSSSTGYRRRRRGARPPKGWGWGGRVGGGRKSGRAQRAAAAPSAAAPQTRGGHAARRRAGRRAGLLSPPAAAAGTAAASRRQRTPPAPGSHHHHHCGGGAPGATARQVAAVRRAAPGSSIRAQQPSAAGGPRRLPRALPRRSMPPEGGPADGNCFPWPGAKVAAAARPPPRCASWRTIVDPVIKVVWVEPSYFDCLHFEFKLQSLISCNFFCVVVCCGPARYNADSDDCKRFPQRNI